MRRDTRVLREKMVLPLQTKPQNQKSSFTTIFPVTLNHAESRAVTPSHAFFRKKRLFIFYAPPAKPSLLAIRYQSHWSYSSHLSRHRLFQCSSLCLGVSVAKHVEIKEIKPKSGRHVSKISIICTPHGTPTPSRFSYFGLGIHRLSLKNAQPS